MSSTWTCSLLLLIAVASSRIGPVKNVSSQPSRKPHIYGYEIHSTIKYRYAITEIRTRVYNPSNIMQQFNFSVIVPETAFISWFSILICEKTEAHGINSSAVKISKTAGHLQQSVRNSDLFSVPIDLLPGSRATFNLTYEERLEREEVFYVNRIHVTPGQVVKALKVSVNIKESLPIRELEISNLMSGEEVNDRFSQNNIAKISRPSDYTADVIWNPTVEQQSNVSKNGISGHIIIRYDVDRQKKPNQILVRGGYFVHSFAINGQSKLPTYTIFILDVSRTMQGTKLEQLKKAMNQILTELTDGDYFTVITFSHNVMVWPTPETYTSNGKYFVEATKVNIQLAVEYVKRLKVIRASNIVDALTKGVELAKSDDELILESVPIIFFVSDGEPTVVEKDTDRITRIITELNNKRCPIFSLAFGNDANFTFLNQLSMSNFGSARKIYVNSISDLEITNFYTDISKLHLTDVSFHYLPEQDDLKSVTDENFRSYFLDKDITVFGKLVSDSYRNITANVAALQKKYPLPKVIELIIEDGDLERMWAYKYMKKLLNGTNDACSTMEALELSPKYSVVTPLTSLVAPTGGGDARRGSRMHDSVSTSTNISSLTTTSFPKISTDTVSTSTTSRPITTTGSPEAVGEISLRGMDTVGRLRSEQTIKCPNSNTEYVVYSNETVVKPIIRAYSVSTNIQHRYAMTVILNKVQNPGNTSQEFTFKAILPDTAFVSSFSMTIKGTTYRSFVAEKEHATKVYEQEKDKGRAVNHVHLLDRDSNTIAISVNIEPMEKVVFSLTYEECLQRENGFYWNRILINPGEVVDELNVFVSIKESSGIKIIEVSDLRSGNEVSSSFTHSKIAQISRPNEDTVEVKWNPSVEQQKRVSKYGVSGQIIIRYDVDSDKEPNRILVSDGYFVHFFAESSSQKSPNYFIFILDISWSMNGTKLDQLKEAMYQILKEIDRTDFFTVITFSTDVQVWWSNKITEKLTNAEGKHIIKANEFNVGMVAEYIKRLEHRTFTNMIAALRTGVNLAQLGKKLLPDTEPVIFFLTDGEANTEERDVNVITRKITELNQHAKCPIFSLAFGMEASFPFLADLSSLNFGFARRVYTASDAFLQLMNFYKQISRIILSNVSFEYISEQIESITNTNFDNYFDGSAIMAAGKLAPGIRAQNLDVSATARYLRNDNYALPKPVIATVNDGNLERLYAFMSIKQFLKNTTGDPSLKWEALKLSIQYSFVTPLTFLVVPKPQSKQQGCSSIPDVQIIHVAMEVKSEQMVDVDIKYVRWLDSKITFPNSNVNYTVETNEPNTPHQDCVLPNTAKGRCRYMKYCVMPEIINSFQDYLPYSCIINNKYAGICCPETGVL